MTEPRRNEPIDTPPLDKTKDEGGYEKAPVKNQSTEDVDPDSADSDVDRDDTITE